MNAFAQLSLPGIVVTCALGALLMSLLVLKYGLAAPQAHDGEGRATGHPLALHLGHAAAVVCFTVAAVLAVVTFARSSRVPSPTASPSPASGGADATRLTAEIKGLQQRLADAEAWVGAADRRLQGVETRVGAAEGKTAALESTVSQASAAAGQALTAVKQLERAAATEPRRSTSPASVRRSAPTVDSPRPALPQRPRSASVEPAPAPAAPDPAASPPSTSPPAAAPAPAPPVATPASPPALPPPPSSGIPPAVPRTEPPPLTTRATPGPSPTREQTSSKPKAASSETSEPDLTTKVQEDWKGIKRDMKAAGDDIRDTWRRFLHWITP